MAPSGGVPEAGGVPRHWPEMMQQQQAELQRFCCVLATVISIKCSHALHVCVCITCACVRVCNCLDNCQIIEAENTNRTPN